MMSWLRKFFAPRASAAVGPLATLSLADGPVYAVGDIHGCHAAFLALEAAIHDDSARLGQAPQIVLLGDLIDRGGETAALLDDLLVAPRHGQRHAIRGNHEDMMLAFLRAPRANADWLRFGGFETLRSYGLALDPQALRDMSERRILQSVMAYLPREHLDYLAALPLGFVVTGDTTPWVLAHAGFDPARGLQGQSRDVLLWGGKAPVAGDGLRLIHGHVIVDAVDPDAPAIGIDTGAYKTGRLSALRLARGLPPHLLQVPPP